MEITCAYCSGEGEHPRRHEICPVCLGRGKLVITFDNPVKCAYCSGSGEHPRKHEICPVCKGAGIAPPVIHEY
jgi:DnaJ-class molecular chaperone